MNIPSAEMKSNCNLMSIEYRGVLTVINYECNFIDKKKVYVSRFPVTLFYFVFGSTKYTPKFVMWIQEHICENIHDGSKYCLRTGF